MGDFAASRIRLSNLVTHEEPEPGFREVDTTADEGDCRLKPGPRFVNRGTGCRRFTPPLSPCELDFILQGAEVDCRAA